MSDEARWSLLGRKWGYLPEWPLGRAALMAAIAGISVAAGRPWSYLGWTIVVYAIFARPSGAKSLAEEVTSIL